MTTDLSPRERTVVRLYTQGLSVGQIASELSIGFEMAKEYIRRARAKYRRQGHQVGSKIALGIAVEGDGLS